MTFPDTVLGTKVELQIGDSYAYCGAAGQETETDTFGRITSLNTATFSLTTYLYAAIEITPVFWTPSVKQCLISKNYQFGKTGANLSWFFFLNSNGTLGFTWSPDGTFANALTSLSSVSTGFTDGQRKLVAVEFRGDNGIGGNTTTFFTANSLTDTYVQLGSPIAKAGTSTLAVTNSDLEIGTSSNGRPGAISMGNFIGKIYGMDLYNELGVRVACPRFDTSSSLNSVAPNTTSFIDATGNTWTLEGSSVINREFVDITNDVQRDHVEISRGRPNEGSSNADPATCTFQLNNTNGNYSPRNPNSPYYKKLTRNTKVRVSLDGTNKALVLPNDQSYAFCPDSAGTSITGDIDIRIELETSGIIGREMELVGKGWIDFSRFSYKFRLDDEGFLFFQWSQDGTTANMKSFTCDATPPLPSNGRIAFRVKLTVANPYTLKFYYSNHIGGTWTQLGSTFSNPNSTSIYNGATETYIGGFQILGGSPYRKIYAVEIRGDSGATTLKASPDFTSQTDGIRTFTDSQSNIWYIAGLGEITSRDYRFHGELVTQPPKWDVTGRDNHIPMKASGILRRLGQGQSPLKSTMFRGLSEKANVTAYWPCEDGKDSTSLSSGLINGTPMDIVQGKPTLATNSTFNCSNPLPQLHKSTWVGSVANHEDTGREQVWLLLYVPNTLSAETVLIRIWFTGATAVIWQLSIDNFGNLRLIGVNSSIALISDSGYIAFDVNTRLLRVSLTWEQNGTGVDFGIWTLEVGVLNHGSFAGGTLNSATLGRINRIDINQDAILDDVTVGHISSTNENFNLFELKDELNAFNGETAGKRVRRLFETENIPGNIKGDITKTTVMGPQLPNTLLELLHEVEVTDGGALFESREFPGLTYRTRESMYSQDITDNSRVLHLNYSNKHISAMEPTDDDQHLRNSIIASRKNGGIGLASLNDGSELSMGVVGIYDSSTEVNVALDSQLVDLANWFLALGTVNEARFPAIVLTLERQVFSSDSALTTKVKALEIGDMVTIDGLPSWLPPEPIAQIVQGLTESMHNYSHVITIHGAPAVPWQAAIYEDTNSRYESQGSYLSQDIDNTTSAVIVSTPVGPVWSADDAPFDIMVAGERMTVTAISGTGTPQTFTCTRHVNGIIKAHVTGEEVRLFRQVRYGF